MKTFLMSSRFPRITRLLISALAGVSMASMAGTACAHDMASSGMSASEAASASPSMASPARQHDVAQRGAMVMPFDLAATLHVFTKTDEGGVQKVVARDPADTKQIALIRQHLKALQAHFAKGDFSAPAQIHGTNMPGLAALSQGHPGDISVEERDVADGGTLVFRAKTPALVHAVHDWFDAQVRDHGHDAMAGSMAHHHHAM